MLCDRKTEFSYDALTLQEMIDTSENFAFHREMDQTETEDNNNSVRNVLTKDASPDPDLIENEKLIINIKQEEGENICDDQDDEQEVGNQMSPVETATLLLLSRIALFNKASELSSLIKISKNGKKK